MLKAIVGIDPSLTGTAVCILNPATQAIGGVTTFKVPKDMRGVQRLSWLRSKLYKTLKPWTPFEAFIEGYAFMAKGRSIFNLGELGGAYRLLLAKKFGGYTEIAPTSLKKFVTGKGNSKKDVMLERTFRKFGIGSEVLTDDNQVDAFGLAMFGLCYLTWVREKSESFDKYEIDAFKGIPEKCVL